MSGLSPDTLAGAMTMAISTIADSASLFIMLFDYRQSFVVLLMQIERAGSVSVLFFWVAQTRMKKIIGHFRHVRSQTASPLVSPATMPTRGFMLSVLLLLAMATTRTAMGSRLAPLALPVLIDLKAPSPAPAFINVTIITPPPPDKDNNKLTSSFNIG